jgi:iron complex outermembrane receptor protein
MHSKSRVLATTALLGCFAAVPAAAQDQTAAQADAPAAADAVSQDIPIAINVFDQRLIETGSIGRTQDLLERVPNMFASSNKGAGSSNLYSIRGIGSAEPIGSFDPAIGTYVDGVPVGGQSPTDFTLFDIGRVEVLRGPQGVLYGHNTVGGAINIILDEPSDTFGGLIEGAYGRFDEKLLRGSLDLPLAKDLFSLKLSGYWRGSDGYVKNTTTGERLNENDGSGMRVAAKFTPTPNLAWNVAVAFVENDGEALLNFACDPAEPSNCDGRFATTGLRKNFPGEDSQFAPVEISGRKADFDLGSHTDHMLVTSNIEWGGENVRLNLITGFADLEQKFALDFLDGRAGPSLLAPIPAVRGFPSGGFVVVSDGERQQFTQEAQLSGTLFGGLVDYVAGLYYFDADDSTDSADVFTPSRPGLPGDGVPQLLADRRVLETTKSWAGYSEVGLNPTEALTLTAGVRYTDIERTFSAFDNRPSCAAGGGACLVRADRSDAALWTPRFAVSYAPNEDLMLYASATRGFRPGGWNVRAITPSELLPFGPEKAWSYEAGFKSVWFDNRLHVNLTGYWMDVANFRSSSVSQRPDGSLAFITQDVADYRNKGVELEVTALPLTGLTTYLNVGWQDDSYRIDGAGAAQQGACLAELAAGQIPYAVGADNAGSCGIGIVAPGGHIAEPVRTPDWSASAGLVYDFAVPAAGAIFSPSVNVSYRSDFETSSDNGSLFTGAITGPSGTVYPANPFGGEFITGSHTSGFVLVNVGFAVRTDDDAWMLSLECDNCLDKTYSDRTLGLYNYLGRPRTWTIRALRKF